MIHIETDRSIRSSASPRPVDRRSPLSSTTMAHSDRWIASGAGWTLLIAAALMTVTLPTARGIPSSTAPVKASGSNQSGRSSGRMDGRPSVQVGQPETFSSKATGLGDLEATDSLKKMNKRSVFGSRGISFEDMEPWVGKRRKDFARANSVRPSLAFEPATMEVPYGSLMAPIPGKQLYALSRIPTSGAGGGGSSSSIAGGSLMGPIVLSRRTEELLGPPVSRIAQLELEEGGEDQTQKFPLLGEFGSRVSLITTRKAQPINQLDLTDYLQDGEDQDRVDLSLAYQMDDVEPVSSQVLIDPAKLIKTASSHQQQPVAARRALGTDSATTVHLMDYMDPNYIPRFARRLTL